MQNHVVITVHGTGHSDANDEGSHWWQKNSKFDQDLRQLSGRNINVEPFHWSGANSEDERRKSGRALAKRLKQLEKQETPYHLVAHSHGGNVALHAFRYLKRIPNQLQSWVTVGTPFFFYKSAFLSPTRLATAAPDEMMTRYLGGALLLLRFLPLLIYLLGVLAIPTLLPLAALLVLDLVVFEFELPGQLYTIPSVLGLILFIGLGLLLLFRPRTRFWEQWRKKKSVWRFLYILPVSLIAAVLISQVFLVLGALVGAAIAPLFEFFGAPNLQSDWDIFIQIASSVILMVMLFLFIFIKGWRFWEREEIPKSLLGTIASSDKWIGLWDRDDEALNALRQAKDIKDVAIVKLSFFSRFAAIVSLLASITITYLMLTDPREAKNQIQLSDPLPTTWSEPLSNIVPQLSSAYIGTADKIVALVFSEAWSSSINLDLASEIVKYIILFLIPFFALLFLHSLIKPALHRLLNFLVPSVNGIIVGTLKGAAFGTDVPGENLMDVSHAVSLDDEVLESDDPRWKALPDELHQEIIGHTDKEIAVAWQRMRQLLGQIATGAGGLNPLEATQEVLTWKELVHTSYFDIDRFNKLIVYAMARRSGADVPEALKRDRHLEQIAVWYEEICPAVSSA